MIFLIIFIDLVGFSIIFPLFPGMLTYYFEREGTAGALGLLLSFLETIEGPGKGSGHYTAVLFGGFLGSIYSFLQFVFAPFWGSLSDRYGRRPILLWTTFGTAFSYLLWIFSGSFLLFVVARLLGGAMAGNLSVASAAIADVTSRENRTKGMALVGIAFGLGFTFGPAIGGLLAVWNPVATFPGSERIGINPFSSPAAFAFLLAAVNFAGVAWLFRETLPVEKRSPEGFARRSPLRIFRERPPLNSRRTNTVYFLYILAFSGMEFTLTFLASKRFELQPHGIGVMFVYVGLVLIVTQGLIVRKLTNVVSEKAFALSGLSLVALAMFVLGLAPSLAFLYLGLTFMALGAGLTNPALTSLASLFAGSANQGEALGLFRSLGSLARAVGPLFAAFIFWWFGSRFSYVCGGLLMLLPLMVCLLLPQPKK